MSDFKACSQNFDSGYIYRVEEREESEEIIRQSARGIISIESNDFPKVIRYFIKNEKGEAQGYIERQLTPNLNTKNSDGDKDIKQKKSKNVKMKSSEHAPNAENKARLDSQASVKSGRKGSNYSTNPKMLYQSNEQTHLKKYMGIAECVSLEGSFYDKSIKNYTLDYTSSNSTPSEKACAINYTASTSNSTSNLTGQRVEHKLNKEKMFSKIFTKKSPRYCKDARPRMFCKDPNKCLKNLFTIIKPNDDAYPLKCSNIELLNKTKELLVKLIDKELQRIQLNHDASESVPQKSDVVMDKSILKKSKLECMTKIEDQLRLLTRLVNY